MATARSFIHYCLSSTMNCDIRTQGEGRARLDMLSPAVVPHPLASSRTATLAGYPHTEFKG
ncbi:hypothetical protein OH77DRAFT_1262327 [Trametes cingulata]|nr:hypothetical protein OH77DRAFT_1262327 [Trametes cingulata]